MSHSCTACLAETDIAAFKADNGVEICARCVRALAAATDAQAEELLSRIWGIEPTTQPRKPAVPIGGFPHDARTLDRAINEMKSILAEDPFDIRTWLKLGDSYAKIDARDSAISAYGEAAKVYEQRGFHLKALACFKQSARLKPSDPIPHSEQARLYRALKLEKDAVFEAIVALRAGVPLIHLDMLLRIIFEDITEEKAREFAAILRR